MNTNEISEKVNKNNIYKDGCSDNQNLYEEDRAISNSNNHKITVNEFIDKIQELLNLNQREKSWEYFQKNADEVNRNTKIEILRIIYNIYDLEKQMGCSCIFEYSNSINELINYYTKLKFLLRRYEYDLEEKNKLFEFIKKHNTSYVTVISVVNSSIVNKTYVLNKVSVELLNNNMLEYALDILLYTYHIDHDNDSTLYNISFVLYLIGDYLGALKFISEIKEENEKVENLKSVIKEGISKDEQ